MMFYKGCKGSKGQRDRGFTPLTLLLYPKIKEEELTLLGDQFKYTSEKHDADNDKDHAHCNFNITHGFAVFLQNGRHPADAKRRS